MVVVNRVLLQGERGRMSLVPRPTSDPYVRDCEITTHLSADTTMERCEGHLIERRGGRVQERSKDSLVVDLGSRTWFRMFGIFTSRLPAKVLVRVEAQAESVRVDVELASDQGWYLTGLPAITQRTYRDFFDEVAAGLRDAVDGSIDGELTTPQPRS